MRKNHSKIVCNKLVHLPYLISGVGVNVQLWTKVCSGDDCTTYDVQNNRL